MDVLIENGKAKELFPDGAPELHPSLFVLKDFQGEVHEAWVWDGESFSPPPSEFTEEKVREIRDKDLNESDWVIMRAMEKGEEVPAPWLEYRQALRDLPLQSGFPEDSIFPEVPKD